MYMQKVWTMPIMSPVFFNLLYVKQSVILYFTKNYIFSSYYYLGPANKIRQKVYFFTLYIK